MTYEQFLAHCKLHASRIFVRDQVNGKWDSVSLYSLTDEQQKRHIDCWWQKNQMPVVAN